MSLLLALPDDLCDGVVIEWLWLPDIVKLDTAVCMKKLRSELMRCFSGMCLSNEYQSHTSQNFIKWSIKRQIKLNKLVINFGSLMDQKWSTGLKTEKIKVLRLHSLGILPQSK